MMTNLWPLVLQTLVIVFAIGASFVRTRERITALETTQGHQGDTLDRMVDKVDGLSRHVALLDGQQKN